MRWITIGSTNSLPGITAGEAYDKQDCETKAFKRLAVKLKDYFPRLRLCLPLDGLYCNEPVMDICQGNDRRWIVVFKEGNLPGVPQEVSKDINDTCQRRKLSVK